MQQARNVIDPADPAEPDDQVDRRSCLWFRGDEAASTGSYRPAGYTLRFRGDAISQHHITHLHEIHHKILNDDTAWGAMIHIAARHPGWDTDFLATLLDRCRLVHEAFATYMAVSLASHRHENAEQVLDAYPIYRPLWRRMNRLLASVPAGHRRDLAATAIARFSMGAPILDLALSVYPQPLSFSQVPSAWTPDQRFIRICLTPSTTVADAAKTADDRFAESEGLPIEDLGLDEADDRLDDAWSMWEATFLSHLIAVEPRLRELPHTHPDSHLAAAADLAHQAASHGIEIPLPHDPGQVALTDAESTQRILTATEVQLRDTPWPAALAEIGSDVAAADVLSLAGAGSHPALVIHGRASSHVGRTFLFETADQAILEAATEPVFAVRLYIADVGGELILNATIPIPDSYDALIRAWPAGQIRANCIAASCYLDADWQQTWGPALKPVPTVILVDTGLVGMIGPGRLLGDASPVFASYVGLDSDSLTALICHVDGHPHILLILADDLTVQLFAGQLQDLLGDRLRMRDADWSEWLPTLAAVTGSLVGTEWSLRFDGLGRS